MTAVLPALHKAVMITFFVAVMMLLIEYINANTQGVWIKVPGRGGRRQYLFAASLGATPGCLGAFILVALFTHGRIGIGAVVAGMIATSGDEMFVMLSLILWTATGCCRCRLIPVWTS